MDQNESTLSIYRHLSLCHVLFGITSTTHSANVVVGSEELLRPETGLRLGQRHVPVEAAAAQEGC